MVRVRQLIHLYNFSYGAVHKSSIQANKLNILLECQHWHLMFALPADTTNINFIPKILGLSMHCEHLSQMKMFPFQIVSLEEIFSVWSNGITTVCPQIITSLPFPLAVWSSSTELLSKLCFGFTAHYLLKLSLSHKSNLQEQQQASSQWNISNNASVVYPPGTKVHTMLTW